MFISSTYIRYDSISYYQQPSTYNCCIVLQSETVQYSRWNSIADMHNFKC